MVYYKQGRCLQCGTLQTSCPYPTSWNNDLDAQYLPYLWLVRHLHCTRWAAHHFPLHPSTRRLSLQDSCVSVSSQRFPQLKRVCFSKPEQQEALFVSSCTHCFLATLSLAVQVSGGRSSCLHWVPRQQQRSTGCAHAEANCTTEQPGQPGHVHTA